MTAPAAELPDVTVGSDLGLHDGREALVRGTYRAVPRPVRAAARELPTDRAVVVLADDTRVWLEPVDEPGSVRPSEERARLEGRAVVVRGVVHQYMPSRGQAPLAPCVRDAALVDPAPGGSGDAASSGPDGPGGAP